VGGRRGRPPLRPGFVGSDTLATARALAAALVLGPFDLVLVGRNSLDGDTGQVGPEIAQLTGLPFAFGCAVMALRESGCRSHWSTTTAGKRSRSSCRPSLGGRAPVRALQGPTAAPGRSGRPRRSGLVTADELGEGPWGQEPGARPGWAGTRAMHHSRSGKVLSGTAEEQVAEALALLEERGALSATRSRPAEGVHGHQPRRPKQMAAPLPSH
jgi:electron transfer flavoprotein alpha subunit